MNIAMFLAELIDAREEAGVTQRGLGEALGLDRSTIVSWENGRSTPTLVWLGRWADQLGYDIVLVEREGDAAPVRGMRQMLRWRPGRRLS